MRLTSETEPVKRKAENFKCLQDWCLLEPIIENVTKGGLQLPDGSVATGELGIMRVLAVGPGALLNDGKRDEMPVKPGDFVYRIAQVRPIQTKLDGKDYLVMQAREFVAIDTRGEDPDVIGELPRETFIPKGKDQ